MHATVYIEKRNFPVHVNGTDLWIYAYEIKYRVMSWVDFLANSQVEEVKSQFRHVIFEVLPVRRWSCELYRPFPAWLTLGPWRWRSYVPPDIGTLYLTIRRCWPEDRIIQVNILLNQLKRLNSYLLALSTPRNRSEICFIREGNPRRNCINVQLLFALNSVQLFQKKGTR
jgi:hypothetical protein